ncbi:hypothetical protein [Geodermatophilus dictyosporus]|uniref:hypothetical protein n=1 Tax=Geodermatophilus dictyosporus TaxID=1523247 RepID=UPI000AB6A49F|nr:hypothetical protein [Geodermatophilus dictyosporus]
MRLVAALLPPVARGAPTRPVSEYKAPCYWLDYRCGFVRRGLPGEVLRRVAGGPPTHHDVERAAAALARASALSIVPVAVEVALRAPERLPRAVAAGLLVSSPLTCSLALGDVGRYDAVGVLALALLSTGRVVWLRLPLPVSAALLAGTVAGAVASEEFLLAVLAPTAVAAVSRLARERQASRTARRWLLGGVLAPGALVAGASLLVPAPRGAVAAARAQAARAGVGPPGALGDALSALERGYVENLAFFRLFRPAAVGLSWGLWAGCHLLTAGVLGRLLGAGADGRHRRAATVHALVATVLSTAGVDFRRWWGLALTGLLATLVLLDPPRPAEPVSRTAIVAALATAAAGVALRDVSVHPWGAPRVDRALPVRT